MGMHNGGIRGNGSSDEIVGIGEVDNDDLILLINLLAYTNKVV